MPPEDEQMAASLQDMATSMNSTNSILGELLKAQSENLKITKARNARAIEETAQKVKNTTLVAKATRFIGNQITGAIQSAFKMQEKSLSVGLTFAEMMDKNAEVTGYLTDGLTGFQTAQTIGAEMFVAGLRGNNKEIARLAVATKLTGGDSRKLLKGMAGLTAGMGFSDEQRSSLANTALSLSQQFGMSTDQLVGALGALADQMDIYAALDIAPELQEGMLRLQAALGPELGEAGVKFANAMLKPEAMIQASLIGIGEERRLISQEINVAENIMKMVKKAGEFAHQQADAFKGVGDNFFNMGVLSKLFGKEFLRSGRLLDKLRDNANRDGQNLEERIKAAQEQRDVNKKFTETWENFKGKVLTPLMQMSITVGNWILGVGGYLVDTVGPLVTSLVSIAGILVALKGVIGFLGIGGAAAGIGGGAAAAGIGGAAAAGIGAAILPVLGIAAAVAGLGWGISKLLEDDEPKVEGSLSLPSQPKTPEYLNTGDSYFMEMQQHKILMALEDNSNTNKLMLEQAELRVDQGEIAHGQNEQIINMNRLRPSDVLGVD